HYPGMLKQFQKANLLRILREADAATAAKITVKGRDLLLFSSNNYLGLTNHPTLKSETINAVQTWGVGSGASRLVSGNHSLYKRLEEKLAALKQTESALVFPTGYMANIGTLGAIAQKGDLILADRLNHASLIDGCRLSQATFRVYRHRDMAHLKTLLSKRTKNQHTLIVTDGVFSMDGDITPLPDILSLAEEYDATIYLDDAHATGVLGPQGGGTASHYRVSSPRLIQMGTLSKALGGIGGFVAGSDALIQYLVNKARSFIYTTALPPASLAAAVSALDVLRQDPSLITRLWENRHYFYEKATQMGFDTLDSQTPIVPILIGDSEKALAFSERLLENGCHVSAIRPPTVPKKSARLRVTLTAAHQKAQIDTLLQHLGKIGKDLGVI
ncbi:MAG: 8-amino-7-oxononanoate synthase, partial [Nitrospiria bacterium]